MNSDIEKDILGELYPDAADPETFKRIQARADILESNLFTEMYKSPDESEASIEIERRVSQPEVITLAVMQFLERFSITDREIKLSLQKAQSDKIVPGKESSFTFNIEDPKNYRSWRTVAIKLTAAYIKVIIKGIPPVPGTNGQLEKFYFDHKKYPGKMLQNGKIDFKELHNFPPVQINDDLFYISYAAKGTPGLTFDGKEIPVKDVSEYDITFQENITTIESGISADGKEFIGKNLPPGYLVRAGITGVAVIVTDKNTIKSIGIQDAIVLDRIDYSVGNIGSELVSPVSIDVHTICEGFKVIVNGHVKIQNLDGGNVVTTEDAEIDQIRPGSSVKASRVIQCRTIGGSSVVSKNEKIIFTNEVIDSTLKAPLIESDKSKTMILNSTLITDEIIFSGIQIAGDNKLILGREHFTKRIKLLRDKKKYDPEIEKINTAMKMVNETTLSLLLKLSKDLNNEEHIAKFRLVVELLQSSSFKDGINLLTELRAHLNVLTVDSVIKAFLNLEKLARKKEELKFAANKIQTVIDEVEQRINNIYLTITGTIKPGATLKIFCNKDTEKKDPDYTLDSSSSGSGKAINISGHYKLTSGLKIAEG